MLWSHPWRGKLCGILYVRYLSLPVAFSLMPPPKHTHTHTQLSSSSVYLIPQCSVMDAYKLEVISFPFSPRILQWCAEAPKMFPSCFSSSCSLSPHTNWSPEASQLVSSPLFSIMQAAFNLFSHPSHMLLIVWSCLRSGKQITIANNFLALLLSRMKSEVGWREVQICSR